PECHNLLAALWSRHPDSSKRDLPKAIDSAKMAVKLNGENFDYHLTLAAAYAVNGQFDEAVAAAEEAVKVAAPEKKDAVTTIAQQFRDKQTPAPLPADKGSTP
ncbi:MAG: hypothetical protein ACRC1K_26425, partial [Planctomycetia bacterium]